MKVIIYAVGQLFERYREKIQWEHIIAIADKKVKYVEGVSGIPLIPPKDIYKLQYDFIAIFSNKMFEEIKMELVGEYFIPKDKIISWKDVLKERWNEGLGVLQSYRLFLKERKCKRILDASMSLIPSYFLFKNEFLDRGEVILEGIFNEYSIYNENLYDKVYSKFCDCSGYYDAILLDFDQCNVGLLNSFKGRTKYILLHTGYLKNGEQNLRFIENKLRKYGSIQYISSVDGLFWIVDTDTDTVREDIDLSIYVVTHKKYNIRPGFPYYRVCVGDYREKGAMTEQTGDNIAYLNNRINECTALYWIWKNTDTRYVGLNHYRRFFYNNKIKSMDNFLDIGHAEAILGKYDIILPEMEPMGRWTVFEQIRYSINEELCEKSYLIIRNMIEKKQPDYLNAFDSVMQGHNAFPCNMFVTRRDILNAYCEWLFSFLIEAAESIDVKGYDSYSQRVAGFFAERMWTVWLRRNKLRIKGLPFVVV